MEILTGITVGTVSLILISTLGSTSRKRTVPLYPTYWDATNKYFKAGDAIYSVSDAGVIATIESLYVPAPPPVVP